MAKRRIDELLSTNSPAEDLYKRIPSTIRAGILGEEIDEAFFAMMGLRTYEERKLQYQALLANCLEPESSKLTAWVSIP